MTSLQSYRLDWRLVIDDWRLMIESNPQLGALSRYEMTGHWRFGTGHWGGRLTTVRKPVARSGSRLMVARRNLQGARTVVPGAGNNVLEERTAVPVVQAGVPNVRTNVQCAGTDLARARIEVP